MTYTKKCAVCWMPFGPSINGRSLVAKTCSDTCAILRKQERDRERSSTPEKMQRNAEWRDKNREWLREYNNLPEVKARRKERDLIRKSTPEYKEKKNASKRERRRTYNLIAQEAKRQIVSETARVMEQRVPKKAKKKQVSKLRQECSCVICGYTFIKIGSTITCSKECSRKRHLQMKDERRRIMRSLGMELIW